ncbi:hypothetical protein RBI14_17005 [Alcaligenaceae bacterium B3P038]|nr:hypothetical protein [Alcaligenaceae bacterium B3P038]
MEWPSNPDGFGAAFFAGEKLKNSDSTTERDIDSFQVELNAQGLLSTLEWMVHWIRAVVAYRGKQYETAFVHIQEALSLAKHSAGKRQYQIVNQYVELSAKADR